MKRDAWAIYSEVDLDKGEEVVYSTPRRIPRDPPPEAERSGDGRWATTYAVHNGRRIAVTVYVNLGPASVARERVRRPG